MKVLGIHVKHPSQSELAFAAFLIAVIAGICVALNAYNVIHDTMVWTTVAGLSTGVILNAFGVSVYSHGWRALLLIVAVASVVWFVVT